MDIEILKNELYRHFKDNDFGGLKMEDTKAYEEASTVVDIVIDTLLKDNPDLQEELMFDA